MSRQVILDSHIHLWPQAAANQETHAWMVPTKEWKERLLVQYVQESGQNEAVKGVVYIETDRRNLPPSSDLAACANGSLDEISFLREILEDESERKESDLLQGIVLWAPMDQPISVLEEYLKVAEVRAGEKVWTRVKGFRFLLQAYTDRQVFERVVFGEHFIANLQLLGRRGYSFDIGVDQRSAGTWQLNAIVKMMGMVDSGVPETDRVVVILNHLCKPDFSASDFGLEDWSSAISAMSSRRGTYVKLSGVFSELPSGVQSHSQITTHVRPWMNHLFTTFGTSRIMFGSDWPVCNFNRPRGDASWISWKEIVEAILDDKSLNLTDADRRSVWSVTASNAYKLPI